MLPAGHEIAFCVPPAWCFRFVLRSEEHTSELQSHVNLVCRLLLEKKNTDFPFPVLTTPTVLLALAPILSHRAPPQPPAHAAPAPHILHPSAHLALDFPCNAVVPDQ